VIFNETPLEGAWVIDLELDAPNLKLISVPELE